eukprot:366517-Chlamydomonas_euryale.AAC.19
MHAGVPKQSTPTWHSQWQLLRQLICAGRGRGFDLRVTSTCPGHPLGSWMRDVKSARHGCRAGPQRPRRPATVRLTRRMQQCSWAGRNGWMLRLTRARPGFTQATCVHGLRLPRWLQAKTQRAPSQLYACLMVLFARVMIVIWRQKCGINCSWKSQRNIGRVWTRLQGCIDEVETNGICDT